MPITMPRFIFSSQTFLSRSPKATILAVTHSNEYNDPSHIREPTNDALLVLLPLLIVLSTFLFLLLLFLICVLLLRRRRGIALRDADGPIDMSRSDLVQGEGGFDGVESRWLESVNDSTRRMYSRAKGASFFPALFLNRTLMASDPPYSRLSIAIPTQLTKYGHHFIPIFVYSGERRLGVVFRSRLRDDFITPRPLTDRAYLSSRPSLCNLGPVQPSSTQAK